MSGKIVLLILIFMTAFVFFASTPDASAFQRPFPQTIATIDPIALKTAKVIAPYLMRALANYGELFGRMGKNSLDLLRLPLGLIQCSILGPWYFRTGINNSICGAYAPFQLLGNLLLLPLAPFGIGMDNDSDFDSDSDPETLMRENIDPVT